MKLLKTNEDGTMTVVNHPDGVNIRGVGDAWQIAQVTGDGTYIADMEDGTYLPFQIKDGQPPQGVDLGDVQYGQPYKKTEEGQRYSQQGGNNFPSLVPDVAGAERETGTAYEDYIPAHERG